MWEALLPIQKAIDALLCVLSVWKLIPDQQGELTLALDMAKPEPAAANALNGLNGKDSFGNGYFGKKIYIDIFCIQTSDFFIIMVYL